MLFSSARYPILQQVKAEAEAATTSEKLDIVAAYLDDVVFAGDQTAVLKAFRNLQAACPTLGLNLNLQKCELVPVASADSTASLNLFPTELKRKMYGNFDLLGAPLEDQTFTREFTKRKRVDEAKQALEKVAELDDAQTAHKLLAQPIGCCRVTYTSRITSNLQSLTS